LEGAGEHGKALVSENDVAYWRTLAEERERALDALRERLRNALAHLPEEHVASFVAALHGAGWMCEPDRMEPLSELHESDVVSVLEDLWARVAGDGGHSAC
jgi:hypothetical protein